MVAEWIDLVLADNIPDSQALTTKTVGRDVHRDLSRFKNKDKIRIVRSLGNESIAVVVTNTLKHVESGKDSAFAFWLVLRDGSWLALELIKTLGLDQFLRDTIPSGREDVPWHMTALVLVMARLCDPSSELSIAENFSRKTAVCDLLGVPGEKIYDNRLYRADHRDRIH